MKKTVVFTVVYPKAESYLNDYLSSMLAQTNKDFDLLIYNDGIEDIEDYLRPYRSKLNIDVIDTHLSPVAIREHAINHIIDMGYNNIIFTDCDDYFSRNRVEECNKYLIKYDIIFNDLTIVDKENKCIQKNYLSNRFRNKQLIEYIDLLKFNVIGFSNSAIKTKLLDKLVFPKDIVALDWYFFSCLLNQGKKAIFLNNVLTYYRQHEQNTAGVQIITLEKLIQGIKVKHKHYCHMAKVDNNMNKWCKKYSEYLLSVKTDNQLLSVLDNIYEKGIKSPLWWEESMIPEEI